MIIKDNEDSRDSSLQIVEEITLDDILAHVGSMGRYQKLIFMLMMPFAFFLAFLYFIQLFVAATPEKYWCKIPELSHLNLEVRRNLSAPGAGTEKMEKCLTYDVNWTEIAKSMIPPPPNTPKVPCKHGWEFELSDIPYETVVTERGWVCDNAMYVPRAQAIFFVGAVIGSLIFGWFADYYGRIPALVGVNLIGGIGGIATACTSGDWDFVICRFITGLSFDNIFYMMYILALEYVGPAHRTYVANMSIALFYGSGCYVLLGLALMVKNWRLLLWVTSIPMLFVIFVPLWLPESIRWYLSKGLKVKALNIVRKFERVNQRRVPDDIMHKFIEFSYHPDVQKERVADLFKNVPVRLAILIMLVVYLSSVLCYDVLVRLSESLGLHLFITFAIMSATEIPSSVLLAVVLDRAGRKRTTFAGMFAAGTLLIIAVFLHKGASQAVVAALARFCVNISWNGATQWAAEMLPTNVRATCSSGLHLSGHFISVFSPYIAFSERVWSSLPLLIIAATVYVGSLTCKLLPETNGLRLPQSVAEAEDIVVEQTFWGRRFKNDHRLGIFVKVKPDSVVALRRPSIKSNDADEGESSKTSANRKLSVTFKETKSENPDKK